MPRELTAELLLSGYAQGIFPMAESREDDRLHWVDPRQRGIFPLDGFHISRSLRRRILQQRFEIRINTAFADVVRACAARPDTWINAPLARHYDDLHRRGHAQSLEVWQDGVLAGGMVPELLDHGLRLWVPLVEGGHMHRVAVERITEWGRG